MDMEHKRNDMQMTDDEIRGSMRKAADKRAQVGDPGGAQRRVRGPNGGQADRAGRGRPRQKAPDHPGDGPGAGPGADRPGADGRRNLPAAGCQLSDRGRMAAGTGDPGQLPAEAQAGTGAGTVPGCAGGARRHSRSRTVPGCAGRSPPHNAPANDAPALCGPAEVVPAWAVTVGGRPALYLGRRELADAVQGHHRPGRGIERGVPG